ncbi:hypothetical protein F5Y19DRAFT_337479 [Xylariaceae sp. FL1651]|nr:hypothetical protein F5Y19DRAFT_337479 [Xylariaceae sp. FL1651]
MATTTLIDGGVIRKRKAHKKSRHGCANCKLRSVKCDETKPCCKRCESFNVICSYGSKFSSESLATKTSFRVHLCAAPLAVVQPLPAPLPISRSGCGLESYQLVPEDIPLIEKFQTHTAWTLGTKASRHVYAEEILPLALSNPLLMHVILAMAEIHERALIPSSDSNPPSLMFHWGRAVSSLQRKLNQPILSSDRDVLWVSAYLISVSTLAHVGACSPAEAWPLRPPSPADLSWLKLCDGQSVLATLTNPLRPDSVFRLPAREMYNTTQWVRGLAKGKGKDQEALEALPRGFEELFGLSPFSGSSSSMYRGSADGDIHDSDSRGHNPEHDNPYYMPAVAAAYMLRCELSEENFLVHICYVRSFEARFRDLLTRKDERAMLLVLYWYAKVCDRRLWWLWKQACTEGLGICRYLDRAWTGSNEKLELLEWPRKRLMTAANGIC